MSILLLAITVLVLSLPTLIILLFSKEEDTQPPNDVTELVEILNEESELTVHVERSVTNEIESIPIEQYVASVVASEMPAEFELEALKAQALAARTYIIQYLLATGSLDTDQAITDTVQHQVYKNQSELKEQWGADYNWKMEKITGAVLATSGQILTYQDEPITPAFFSTSNGKTENAEDYWENSLPYLVSVESPWDVSSPRYLDQKSIPIDEVESLLGIRINAPVENPPTTYTDSGRVKTVQLGGEFFTGRQIREALKLRSTDFEIEQKDDHLIFTTKGFGHGVGMSQYGANGMAEEGKTYQEIVEHYYQGVEIAQLDEAKYPELALKSVVMSQSETPNN
nr:stage II sporulation protein D [Amphibacillus xylanus]